MGSLGTFCSLLVLLMYLVDNTAHGQTCITDADGCDPPVPCTYGQLIAYPPNCYQFQRCLGSYQWELDTSGFCDGKGPFNEQTCDCDPDLPCLNTTTCPPSTRPPAISAPCAEDLVSCETEGATVADRSYCTSYFRCTNVTTEIWVLEQCPPNAPYYSPIHAGGPVPCVPNSAVCADASNCDIVIATAELVTATDAVFTEEPAVDRTTDSNTVDRTTDSYTPAEVTTETTEFQTEHTEYMTRPEESTSDTRTQDTVGLGNVTTDFTTEMTTLPIRSTETTSLPSTTATTTTLPTTPTETTKVPSTASDTTTLPTTQTTETATVDHTTATDSPSCTQSDGRLQMWIPVIVCCFLVGVGLGVVLDRFGLNRLWPHKPSTKGDRTQPYTAGGRTQAYTTGGRTQAYTTGGRTQAYTTGGRTQAYTSEDRDSPYTSEDRDIPYTAEDCPYMNVSGGQTERTYYNVGPVSGVDGSGGQDTKVYEQIRTSQIERPSVYDVLR